MTKKTSIYTTVILIILTVLLIIISTSECELFVHYIVLVIGYYLIDKIPVYVSSSAMHDICFLYIVDLKNNSDADLGFIPIGHDVIS